MKNKWKDREEQLMKNNRFRELVGVQIEEVDEGRAVLSLPIQSKLLQSADIVHGGVISVLLDSVIGTAVRTIINDNMISLTAEMNINYFRPATKGKIIAEAKVINRSKLLVVGSADIKDEEGRLLATGRATYVIKESVRK